VSMASTTTLTELSLTKLNVTDAPSEERTAPMSPQESSLPPLTLTPSVAGCVGFGVGFGEGFGVGLALGFGVDLVVDALVEGTVPGAVVAACVVAFCVVGCVVVCPPGRLDGAEECGVVRPDPDGDDEDAAGC
jgi:hypothetical protein